MGIGGNRALEEVMSMMRMRTWSDGISVPVEETPESFLFLVGTHTWRKSNGVTWQCNNNTAGYLEARKRAVIRLWACWNPAPRTVGL